MRVDATTTADAPGADADARLPRGVAAMAALAAGLVLASVVPAAPGWWWFAAGVAAAGAALASRGGRRAAFLATAGVALGAGWYALRVHETATDHLPRLVGPGEPVVLLEGLALDDSRARFTRSPADAWLRGAGPPGVRESFRLRVRAVGPPGAAGAAGDPGALRRASGVVWVSVESPGGVRAGDAVRLTGTLRPVAGPRNPGEPDGRPWAAQESRAGRVQAAGPAEVLAGEAGVAAWGPGWRIEAAARGQLGGVRRWGAGVLERALPEAPGAAGSRESIRREETRAVLGLLLLGRPDPAAAGIEASFARLGLLHALSISGFHLAVMASMALFLVRLTGERGALEPLAVAALVVLYVALVPAEAPVLRSAIGVLVFLAAEATGRRYDRLGILGWAGVVLLLWRPVDLWAAGFQLSFGVTAALLWLGEPLRAAWFGAGPEAGPGAGSRLGRAAWRWATGGAAACVLAWAVSTPLVAHHAGIVSPLAPLVSFALVPLVTVALWLGLGAMVLTPAPLVGALAAGALAGVGDALVWCVRGLDSVPGGAIPLPAVGLAPALLATGVVVAWLARRRGGRALWAATGAALAWIGVIVWSPRLEAAALRIDALAIERGACTILRAGPEAILLDAGSASRGEAAALARTVPRAVRAGGGWRVRTAVLTSARVDAACGLPELIRPLGIEDVLIDSSLERAAQSGPGSPAAALLADVRARGARVRVVSDGDSIRLGGAVATFRAGAAGLALKLTPAPGAPAWRRAGSGEPLAAVGLWPRGRITLDAGRVEAISATEAALRLEFSSRGVMTLK